MTLDPAKPSAEAVAVVNGRILVVGSLEDVQGILKGQRHKVDTTFSDKVIVPGFIAQHDHPLLAALAMSSEILSIEDWVLPSGTVPAVKDKKDFIDRLTKAVEQRTDPSEPSGFMGVSPCILWPPQTSGSRRHKFNPTDTGLGEVLSRDDTQQCRTGSRRCHAGGR